MTERKMTERKMRERMRMVFTDEQIRRVVVQDKNQTVNLIADVHGMGCQEATMFVKNLVALFTESFKLTVVHGYHNGTAIRDTIRKTDISPKVTRVHWTGYNDGVTEFNIRTLCA